MVLNQQFVLLSVEGLHAVVVTDRDGVPVIKGKTEAPVTVFVVEMFSSCRCLITKFLTYSISCISFVI